jgi:hypothetical protein
MATTAALILNDAIMLSRVSYQKERVTIPLTGLTLSYLLKTNKLVTNQETRQTSLRGPLQPLELTWL